MNNGTSAQWNTTDDKKEQTIDSSIMDESSVPFGKWKKPDPRLHIVEFHLYETLEKKNSENISAVAIGWREWLTTKGQHEKILGVM